MLRPVVTTVRLVLVLAILVAATGVTAAALLPQAGDLLTAHSSTAAEVELQSLSRNSFVYDKDGELMGQLTGPINRVLVELDAVSDEGVQSVLTAEDEDFYNHNGISLRAITRAMIQNVAAGGIEQGGSTITQQLVKNSVLENSDLDLTGRKIPEAALAVRLEKQMSKDEILEAYLNTVYFGAGAYGIEAASQVFFGHPAAALDWAEGALLASLISSPVSGDPTRNPELARERRDRVLDRLFETGHIETREELVAAKATALPNVRLTDDQVEETYFLEEVKQRLLDDERLGETSEDRIEAIFAGGLRIFTTYDPRAQAYAEQAVAEIVPPDIRGFTAALAAVEVGTGAVRALVGGPGFDTFQFNIATQKGRPTGSSFKPFVLAAAMEAGYLAEDQVNGGSPCQFPNPGGTPDPYEAANFSRNRGGVASIRSLTLSSSNCGYLRLAQIVGLSNVTEIAEELGVTSPLNPVLSLPLGPADITPLEMATAYAAFPNDGVSVAPYFIERVEDREGNLLFSNEPVRTRAISPESAHRVTDILEDNVRSGTGTRARLPNMPAAGKTGTAQDFKDAWFVGYTPFLATAVWMGAPGDPIEMRNVGGVSGVTGGSFPAQIWGRFNTLYHEGLPSIPFAEPPRAPRSGERLYAPNERPGSDPTAPYDDGCPSGYVPGPDGDGDGEPDTCVRPTATTTTTTTVPGATTTTLPGSTTTTLPPSTTAPPTTTAPTTTAPPTTTTTTTAAPPPP
jgi:penicillin-binding protein 1A